MSQHREHFGITQGPPFGRLGTTSGNASPVAEAVFPVAEALEAPEIYPHNYTN